jgi:hypothetical protein
MMSQDTSEDALTTLQGSSDLLERLLDQAHGGPDSRWSRVIKALSEDELITLLSATQARTIESWMPKRSTSGIRS